MDNYKYMVQTRCMTYNHAPYILEAMNGFCMQKTTFPFVNVIVDDDSTDGEPEVIEKYLQEHFNLQDSAVARREETDDYRLVFAQHKTNKNCYFVVLYLKYNHFLKKDKKPYYEEWTNASKYIAMCEGDDYWTDPYKLQKQVDSLESHPDYVACFHNSRIYDGTSYKLFNDVNENPYPTTEDIITRHWFIATQTLMYRRVIQSFPEWGYKVINGDYLLELLLAKEGKFYYMDDLMSVYRELGQGISATILDANKIKMYDGLIYLYEHMKELYAGEYADAFDKSIANYQRLKAEYQKELFYESHPILRALRPKTYKRLLKQWLRRLV